MPIYEYSCPDGHRFERFVRKISDAEAAPACPVCGKTASRLISGAGLVFKGSGFYITDYGKDGKKAQTPAPKSEGAKGDSGKSDSGTSGSAKSDAPASTPKTDSAPAAKPKGGE